MMAFIFSISKAKSSVYNSEWAKAFLCFSYLDGFKNPEFIDLKEQLANKICPKWTNVKAGTNNTFSNKLSKRKNGQLSDLKHTFIVLK